MKCLASLCLCFWIAAANSFGAQYYSTTGMYVDLVYDQQFNAISYKSYVPQLARYGVRLDRLVMTDSGDATKPGDLHGYQMTARILDSILSDSLQYTGQRKIILDLFNTFFILKDYGSNPANWQPCLGYGNESKVRYRGELRADYAARMADFMSYLWAPVTAADFEFISVNPESGCTPPSQITAAAQAVKNAIPNVKVAAGYPISVDDLGIGNGINHNGLFPAAVDRIITWSYGVMDPANDYNPLNYASTFSSYYGILKSKMRSHHTIDWILDAHFLNSRHGNSMGWIQGLHHAQAAVNWAKWIATQAKINGMIAFTYGNVADAGFFSLAEMPQIVTDTHANVSFKINTLPNTLRAADAFTGATAGQGVIGRPAEVGGVSWLGNANAVFGTGAQADLTGKSGANPIATVPFNPASFGNKPVTVTADLNPQGASWTAIGFANHSNWGWWTDGQVWVYINNSSRYNILAKGTTYSLSGGLKYDARVRPNQYNRVELTYDPVQRKVQVWINGWQVLGPTLIPGGFVPAIQYAGWSALGSTQNQTRMDSFEVKN